MADVSLKYAKTLYAMGQSNGITRSTRFPAEVVIVQSAFRYLRIWEVRPCLKPLPW